MHIGPTKCEPGTPRPPRCLFVCIALAPLCSYADAKEMAARQLPHLAWPEPGSGAAPPMLSFYSFVEAEVVTC